MARSKKSVKETAAGTHPAGANTAARQTSAAASAPLIFLIGSRGSGKTTAARLLADRLGWMWVDADDVIEQRHGKTIREMITAEGEENFRDKEAGVLTDLCRMRRHVIATGGGVIVRPENRDLLGRSGWCVWLTADAETMWQRMREDPTSLDRRPALTVGGIKEVAELLKNREELYQGCANYSVPTTGRTPDAVVADILKEWFGRGSEVRGQG